MLSTRLPHAHLAGLDRGEPFSLFLELNLLLNAGVLAFVAGFEEPVSPIRGAFSKIVGAV